MRMGATEPALYPDEDGPYHIIQPEAGGPFEVWPHEKKKAAWNGSGYEYNSWIGARDSEHEANKLAGRINEKVA